MIITTMTEPALIHRNEISAITLTHGSGIWGVKELAEGFHLQGRFAAGAAEPEGRGGQVAAAPQYGLERVGPAVAVGRPLAVAGHVRAEQEAEQPPTQPQDDHGPSGEDELGG